MRQNARARLLDRLIRQSTKRRQRRRVLLAASLFRESRPALFDRVRQPPVLRVEWLEGSGSVRRRCGSRVLPREGAWGSASNAGVWCWRRRVSLGMHYGSAAELGGQPYRGSGLDTTGPAERVIQCQSRLWTISPQYKRLIIINFFENGKKDTPRHSKLSGYKWMEHVDVKFGLLRASRPIL